MDWLKETLDKSFAKMIIEEFQMTTSVRIPIEMCVEGTNLRQEYKTWRPIDSIIDEENLDNLEAELNFKLPKSYREFLMYKHFLELNIDDFCIDFPRHLPDKSLKDLKQKAIDFYEPGYLLEHKLFYFADFCDCGLICFDAKEQKENNEYDIVYIDHEDIERKYFYAHNFKGLLLGDKETGNRFITEVLNKRNY